MRLIRAVLFSVFLMSGLSYRMALAAEDGLPAGDIFVATEDKSDELISVLEAKDEDIVDVIETIARKSGLNIVTGPNLQGRVTIFLKNVNARDALRMVLETNGLAFCDEGGIIRVMSAEEYANRFGHAFGQERVTRMIRVHFASVTDLAALLNEMKSEQGKVIANVEGKSLVVMDTAEKIRSMEALVREADVQTMTLAVPLKYARAQDLVDELRPLLTRSIGTIECDTAANTLIVTDTPTCVGKIKSSIEQRDLQSRRIVVQAKLVHVILNNEHLGGVDWSGIVEEFRSIRLWGAYEFLTGDASSHMLSVGVIEEEDFPYLLEALDTVGMVREYPFSDITVTQAEAVKAVVRLDDLTLELDRIRAEDAIDDYSNTKSGLAAFEFYIRLVINAEDELEVSIIPHEPRPVKKTARPVSHTATIKIEPGRSIVIGGLVATEKVATTRKIPLMGDIPLLGRAFRFHGSAVQREEFVVFLSPSIWSGDSKSGSASVSDPEDGKAQPVVSATATQSDDKGK